MILRINTPGLLIFKPATSSAAIFIRDARYWIFADIRYANIWQLIWRKIDTDTDVDL